MSESSVELRLRTAVKKAGGIAIKLWPVYMAGVPDRLVLLPGARCLFIELKRIGGRRASKQRRWQRRLRALGFVCEFIEGREELDVLIQTVINLNITTEKNE